MPIKQLSTLENILSQMKQIQNKQLATVEAAYSFNLLMTEVEELIAKENSKKAFKHLKAYSGGEQGLHYSSAEFDEDLKLVLDAAECWIIQEG